MHRLRFCCVVLLLGGAVVRAASPADWKLPPLDGELSGQIDSPVLGGAPKLNWKLTLATPRPRERHAQFLIEGVGARIRGEALLDPMGEGTWHLAECAINIADWFGWLAPEFMPKAESISLAGKLALSGEGTWRGGKVGGRVTLNLLEGRFEDPPHKILLEGIAFEIEVADLAARRTPPAQVFTWRNGHYDVINIGTGRIEFQLDGDQARVTEAAIDVFGGELRVGSLVMSTSRPEFSVTARMVGVAIDQVMFLLPHVLSEAKGRLDGDITLKHDESGLEIGNGQLSLRQGETADLRLAVQPGWLTTSLPPAIVKYFPAFRKIENGEIPIRARVLEINLTPDGDAEGRTARIHVAGGPSDPELTAPMDLNVNVRGPLQSLVKIGANLGTDSRLHFGAAR